ncbi:MAG: type IV toxin-antitoxin system AbiEi family antitoxin domain-containing protein [Bacteriovoracaceae bacterium]
MKDIESLLQKLPKDVFTLQEASMAGVSRYYLSKMIEAERISELRRGVYQRNETNRDNENIQETSFKVATAKLKEKSAICLWSALSYYDITEQVPSLIWAIVPYPYDSKYVRPIRLKKPQWDIGIIEHDGFSITSIERTLIECFLSPRYVAVSEAFASLKQALKEKKTTMKKILATAELLGVKEKIYPFIEIALSQL